MVLGLVNTGHQAPDTNHNFIKLVRGTVKIYKKYCSSMSTEKGLGGTRSEVKQTLTAISDDLMRKYRNSVEFALKMREKGPAYKEAGEYLVAKGFWLSLRLIGALTGVSMDYLTPLDARIMSYKEFMT